MGATPTGGPAPTEAQIARPLHAGFERSAASFPGRPALEVGGRTLSYAELRDYAASLAATLIREAPGGEPALTAVFAYRSATAFAGLLGALMRGHGYVPLNHNFPLERTRLMLEHAGCNALIVDTASLLQLEELLDGVDRPMVLILPEESEAAALVARFPGHTVVTAPELEPAASLDPVEVDPGDTAYLLFTSGSTGTPKAVMVSHRNANHYVDVLVQRYSVTEHDRFSQTAEMTFDNSVLDMFVPWQCGACVCCPSRKTLIKPGRYIRESELTVWFSVPSTAIFMRRLGALKPASYPSLRWSLFAGEALPAEVAEEWLVAAPNCTVENLYGPTEVTVDCLIYRWDPARSPDECEHGVVPIGYPVPGMTALVADEALHEVEPGTEGELLVSGPQVSLGYLRDPERTAAAFVVPPGHDAIHYRTGDLVRRPADPDAPVPYLGRLDHQIQIFGERIELGEVEAAIREESGVDAVVALGWPVTTAGAGGIEAFVADPDADAGDLKRRLRERLPGQMAPRGVHVLPELPLNDNGKFDRKALMKMLEEAT
ncbi:MAG TPA: amino acid adenylation domain-containing protein [Thermoleophilaceae bacterium]|nr:amino acid adenylation domain-containing protein [Thermoleophilaceae bacterium]